MRAAFATADLAAQLIWRAARFFYSALREALGRRNAGELLTF